MQFPPRRGTLLVLWLIAISCPASIYGQNSSDKGFVSLFDGKTLAGWNVEPKTKASDWAVRDGVIVGRGDKGRSCLA